MAARARHHRRAEALIEDSYEYRQERPRLREQREALPPTTLRQHGSYLSFVLRYAFLSRSRLRYLPDTALNSFPG